MLELIIALCEPGQNLSTLLLNNTKLKEGAKVVLHKVQNPELFGIAQSPMAHLGKNLIAQELKI